MKYGQDSASAADAAPSWTHSWDAEKLAAPRSHARTLRCVLSVVCAENLQTQASPRNPGGSPLRNPGRLIFPPPAVPGRSAALDVCVASSNAAAARGDAAQAAFHRKLSAYRQEIPDLRNQGIHYRPLVWTADGRARPAVTRTLVLVGTASRCRRNHSSAGGSMKFKLLFYAGEQP